MTTAPDSAACPCCRAPLYADELGRQACFRCQDRADTQLAALAGPDGLYARLSAVLAPGSGTGAGRVSGSRTAPLPCRLDPLSLSARGGVVTVLQTWQADWHERLCWTHPRWTGGLLQQCDQTVHALRTNLPWAAAAHPAFDEFAGEVRRMAAACRAAIGDEKPERRIPLACGTHGCTGRLHVTLSTPGQQCRACGRSYTWEELRDLLPAVRAAA